MKTVLVYELFEDQDAGNWYGHAELIALKPDGKPDWSKKPLRSLRDMEAASRQALIDLFDQNTVSWERSKLIIIGDSNS